MRGYLLAACSLTATLALASHAEAFGGGSHHKGGSSGGVAIVATSGAVTVPPVSAPEPLILLSTGIGLLTAAMFGRRLR